MADLRNDNLKMRNAGQTLTAYILALSAGRVADEQDEKRIRRAIAFFMPTNVQ